MSETPVVVAGAGPVGMIAAIALDARGVPVEVYEADPEDRDRPGSRAIYIHGATIRTLETLHPGLGWKLADAGMVWPTRRTRFRGKDVFERTYPNAAGGDDRLPPFSSLPQVRTEALLLEAVEELDIPIHWDSPVEAVETSEDGVEIEIGGGDVVETPYLVGADGAGSTVRKEIGVEFSGEQSENSFIIIDVDKLEDETRPIERVFHYDDPDLDGRNVLVVPFQGGWRVDIQCEPDDDPEHLASDAVVSDLVARVLGEAYADRIDWVSVYQFKQVNADSYTDDHRRVLLAGEAAHLFAPFGARGLNSGVPDADAAASTIAVARGATVDSVAAAEIGACAERRRRAGDWNRDAAGQALEYLQGTRLTTKLAKRAAAEIAPYWERAGEWLDDAPYGPHGSPPVTVGRY